MLFLLASGQNAFAWSPVPTFLRKSLAKAWAVPALPEEEFKLLVSTFEEKLNNEFNWDSYISLTEQYVLNTCNQSLDSLLKALELNRGRTVRRIKKMHGLTRLLGLSYGGPAYHDPLTGEVALISEKDNPAPKFWRYHAICHETAHAKGFTREMDVETLTQLALLTSNSRNMQIIGYILFLQKSGEKFKWPEQLKDERKLTAKERKAVRAKQPLVRLLSKINQQLHIQNTPKKYGNRKKGEAWNPEHPYFSTVVYLLRSDALKPHSTE